jgi:hypothetical protein
VTGDGLFETIARTMSDPFVTDQSFEQGEVSGQVRLGRFEAEYEELFAEALEDGVITPEERARLERAASSLGLDRARIRAVEEALVAAYASRHGALARDVPAEPPPVVVDEPQPSLRPFDPSAHVRALEGRIRWLESRVAELEHELEEARAHVAVEIDVSGFTSEAAPSADPEELQRRIRHDPRDADALHALFAASSARDGADDPDRAFRVAQVLVHLGAASSEEAAAAKRSSGELIRPKASLGADGWKRFLFHPDEELLTGEIFSVVAGPVLLGRVAALRHQGTLPKLDPAKMVDPKTSTIQAVRCFAWAASILGMPVPRMFADPSWEGLAQVVPNVPPASRLGRGALSGRTAAELAFLAGRHVAGYREDHFVRHLVPGIEELEDIFLAALTIGRPSLPLAAAVKARAAPIAKAIEPLLEPSQLDRLRGHFLRFVEEGGRTNLQRWAAAADFTTARAGLLLAGDLGAATTILRAEGSADVEARVDDLLVFWSSDRAGKLRSLLGVSVA